MPDDIGPQPTPKVEPGDPNPGGADAIDDTGSLPLPADLDPERNPQVDDVVPEEITAPDDQKTQEPEGEADDKESGTQPGPDGGKDGDPDAGQEDESGKPEPPA